MKILLLFTLLFQAGCATKYIVPGNRFLTPESQGGAFRGQAEFQQTSANQLAIDTSNGSVDDGVKYNDISRSGFLVSNSIFDPFDLYWSHIGGANSMVGAKFQFMGGSRTSNSVGHKMSVAAAVGGNEHETDDKSIEFDLSGKEYMLLYGFRFSPNILTYSTFSYSVYKFDGDVKKGPLTGQDPKFETSIKSLSGGAEFSINPFFAKLEATYQQLETTDSNNKSRFIFGYSLGMSW